MLILREEYERDIYITPVYLHPVATLTSYNVGASIRYRLLEPVTG